MDSDEETNAVDSGNESSGPDEIEFAMEIDVNSGKEHPAEVEEYPFEVLSTDEIVQHMSDSIKDVNLVVEVCSLLLRNANLGGGPSFWTEKGQNPCCLFVQIPATTTRILLNHFKWDKEKLMERYYDGDQEVLFAEARVINPFKKSTIAKQKVITGILVFECVHFQCFRFR